MPRRRAAHEGSIRKRRDGRWEARVMLSGHRYSVYGRTRAEAVQKLQELLLRHREGRLLPPTGLSFEDWAREWLEGCRGRLRPKTVASYEDSVRALLPHLGRHPLHRLSPLHLRLALDALAREGRGGRFIVLTYGALRACLNEAQRLGLIAQNPAGQVSRPRYEKGERPRWEADQARRFLRAAQERGDPLSLMAGIALLTGCRLGELLGLTWADVDVQRGSLRVARALVWVRGRPVLQGPKTRTAERVVPLGRLALSLLERLERRGLYVFWSERPPTTKQVSQVMTELCRLADVSRINFHGLRGVAASLLVAQGVELRAVQQLLGHARPSITLDTYSRHVTPQSRAVAEALEMALRER